MAERHKGGHMNEAKKSEWKGLNEAKHDAIEAFRDKKYGMFIHWGLYSQLAGVYRGQRVDDTGRADVAEWAMHAFEIPRDEYRQLAKDFCPEQFSAKSIVQLAVDSGMRYLVITAKHHDGFALFKSDASDFNVVDATPFGRDIISELYAACAAEGIAFGLYYSHSIDWMDGGNGGYTNHFEPGRWNHPLTAHNDFDPSPVGFADYVSDKALPQVRELLTRFPNLIEIWYDVPYFMDQDESFEFYRTVGELQPQTLVNARVGNELGDYDVPGDNVVPDELSGRPWETPGTTNTSWGFKSYDNDWKEPAEILFWIVSIISKGGNYLLNIGPRPDGTVPEESAAILRRVGQWLRINGDAIYGTRPWKVAHEGPTNVSLTGSPARQDEGFSARFTRQDFWFSSRENDLFAVSLFPGPGDTYLIRSLVGHKVESVSLLGGAAVRWSMDDDGLHLQSDEHPDDLGVVFRIRLG
jgi:alpha-L-fucosidase